MNKKIKINNVYLMDVIDFLNSIEDNTIDLAIIDPPYNIGIDKWDGFNSFEEFMNFTKNYLSLVYEKLKDNGSLYIFNTAFNSAYILCYINDELKMKFQNWIIWHKKDGFNFSKKKYVNNQETILFFKKNEKAVFNYDEIREPYESNDRIEKAKIKGILKNGKRWFPNPKGKLCTDVWTFSSVRHTKKINGKTIKQIHPTPKPEKMIQRMIEASTNEGDLVLDLFSGSGTTSYVAKKIGRNFLGCENNEIFFKYIKDRLDGLNDK